MKVFIWTSIEKLTDNYHSEGGLVVVAKDLERAYELARNEGVEFTTNEYSDELTPDVVYNTDDSAEEKVFIFPDAGCC